MQSFGSLGNFPVGIKMYQGEPPPGKWLNWGHLTANSQVLFVASPPLEVTPEKGSPCSRTMAHTCRRNRRGNQYLSTACQGKLGCQKKSTMIGTTRFTWPWAICLWLILLPHHLIAAVKHIEIIFIYSCINYFNTTATAIYELKVNNGAVAHLSKQLVKVTCDKYFVIKGLCLSTKAEGNWISFDCLEHVYAVLMFADWE